jgi:hypothetical protein
VDAAVEAEFAQFVVGHEEILQLFHLFRLLQYLLRRLCILRNRRWSYYRKIKRQKHNFMRGTGKKNVETYWVWTPTFQEIKCFSIGQSNYTMNGQVNYQTPRRIINLPQ